MCLVAELWLRQVILGQLLPFHLPEGSKNFLKIKKMPRDIIITLHQDTKNYDMMYDCRVMAWDGQTERWTDGRKKKVTYRSECST